MTDPNTDPKPAGEATPAPAPESGGNGNGNGGARKKPQRIARFQIGVNVVIQVIICFVILLMANYLGYRHYERLDFSRNKKFTLSEKTMQVIKATDEPVKIIVWFDVVDPLYREVDTLLSEYQMRSKGKIDVEYVDPLREAGRSRELQAQYGFRENESVIVLDNKRNTKFVYGADMVEYEPLDPMLAQVGIKPEIKNFLGEQRLTSALQEVQNKEKPKVYFTQGHREPAFEGTKEKPSPIEKGIKEYLTKEGMELGPLALLSAEEVPADAGALVIIGPQFDFTNKEIEMLDRYWTRGGSFVIYLDPNFTCLNLVDFCARKGIIPTGDRIVKTSIVQSVAFVYVDVNGTFLGNSAVSESLKGAQTQFRAGTQSLKLDEALARKEKLTVVPLLVADPDYWGEVNYPKREGDPAPELNKGLDHEAPLYMAAVAEQVEGNVTRRLMVCGSSAVAEDATIVTPQNLQLAINSVNWSLDRTEILGVPPREPSNFKLSLNPAQRLRIWYLCILLVPSLAAFIGFLVWLKRRK